MRFPSTRGGGEPVSFDAAIAAGLAPDGGLYVPERIPQLALDGALDGARGTLAGTAAAMLAPYLEGSRLRGQLDAICRSAFAFNAPLRPLSGPGDHLLELFHGPTAAFKDFAATFLAETLSRLRMPGAPVTTILVATSGDTGAAVGAAFHRREGFRVVILYPHGRVSPRQAHGLGSFGDNVQALRVDGSFDDCQAMVKHALGDEALRRQLPLGAANSISLGRLLPQTAYYAHAALGHRQAHGRTLNFIVPTGNLGNGLACWLARRMGLPIGDIVLACNANDALPRYLAGDEGPAQPTRATLANAMDVGAPSNLERLRWWRDRGGDAGGAEVPEGVLRACSVGDPAIAATIAAAPGRHGVVPCPHTAVGLHALAELRRAGDTRDWAVVATAHPAKFDRIVEPLVGEPVPLPPALRESLARPSTSKALPASPAALVEFLRGAA